ncbi:MAG: cysteine-rich KTR domain-containing protein [Lachnospiraceae bacterium]|nr:cysteine-rich KTR domain-containing protein [Lachnospiraceae bacterium]
MVETEWIRCPVCGNKTRDKIRKDTLIRNYPLYCPKCKNETLIEIENMKLNIIKEPDAKAQSRKDAEPMNL